MQYSLAIIILAFAAVVVGCDKRSSTKPPPSNIKTDEDISFFPTYGRYDQQTDAWLFDVQGKVVEPEQSSAKRAALLAILRASVDASVSAGDTEFRDDRIRPFLVDNERGKSVTIEVAGEQFRAGTSAANGRFSSSLILRTDSLGGTPERNRIQEIEAVLPAGDSRTFTGRLHLIAPEGISVISDIDDTIKHSQVTDKSELLRNTFMREFLAVDGMAQLYTDLADSEVAFHYVSGSPWQLLGPLEEFMDDVGFPKGTFHLKQFRLKDSSVLDLLSSQEETKRAAIEPLLDAFPKRTFILIGDSGEQDPEIYGRIARDHPNQIIAILIRNATGEKSDGKRFSDAFQSIPRDRWALFDDGSQIADQVTDHISN